VTAVQNHVCPYCQPPERFTVEEPAPAVESGWESGRIRVTIRRTAWELPMVAHWYEKHPDTARFLFPGAELVQDAVLLVAQRAERSLMDRIRAAIGWRPDRLGPGPGGHPRTPSHGARLGRGSDAAYGYLSGQR
jgi:hypothetical protein